MNARRARAALGVLLLLIALPGRVRVRAVAVTTAGTGSGTPEATGEWRGAAPGVLGAWLGEAPQRHPPAFRAQLMRRLGQSVAALVPEPVLQRLAAWALGINLSAWWPSVFGHHAARLDAWARARAPTDSGPEDDRNVASRLQVRGRGSSCALFPPEKQKNSLFLALFFCYLVRVPCFARSLARTLAPSL